MNLLLKKKIILIIAVSIIFTAINLFFISSDNYIFSVLPAIVLIIFLALTRIEVVLYFVAFSAPLSIGLSELVEGLPIDMQLPTEPLLFGILIICIIRFLMSKEIDKRIFFHPVSIALICYLLWMFICALTSSLPLVSFKYLISNSWFITGFFFLPLVIFKKNKNIKTYFWLYITSFSLVIIYTLIRHAGYGFAQKPANWVMSPFYHDHTSYGAAQALIFPILLAFAYLKRNDFNVFFMHLIVLIILLAGIIFSYTRASWISIVAAAGMWIIIKFRIKITTILGTLLILFLIIFPLRYQIYYSLKGNEQDSSSDFSKHIESMSNISSDASNLERLNRWSCAYRMFQERPITGWGPGTYMFQYAPFQLSKEKTVISTNASDLGNAHSEYLGSLSEMGLPGMLSVISIFSFIVYTGLRAYKRNSGEEKTLCLAFMIGLFTYMVHAFLNNFLDYDKISILFWGFSAALVHYDMKIHDEKQKF